MLNFEINFVDFYGVKVVSSYQFQDAEEQLVNGNVGRRAEQNAAILHFRRFTST